MITLYLVVPYAVDVQPTLKEHKTINAKRNISNKVVSLVDRIKSAIAGTAATPVFAVAA